MYLTMLFGYTHQSTISLLKESSLQNANNNASTPKCLTQNFKANLTGQVDVSILENYLSLPV